MADRTTRAEIERLAAIVAEMTDATLILDHNSTYGGWTLRAPSGPYGGETDFGPPRRVSAGEMAYALRVAIAALRAAEHLHQWERRAESGRVPSGAAWQECRCGAVKPGTEHGRRR